MKSVMTLALTLSLLSAATLVSQTPPAWAAEGAIVDVGNRVCPVSGDKVSGKHFVVYEGKRYGLCCPHCEKEFKKDPAKYIAQLEAGTVHEHAEHDPGH